MKIIDINGLYLEIENLQLAIMQADDYRHYEHIDPLHRQADEKLKAYWEDIYQKLLQLQG
ncbi:hypothetical protein EOD41_16745 [Mucilaginibacter limnophilus]|uniref:3-isopropylmalate dehydratase n=1 Tax=Mucilaginibacter limnophilus TaxID=1932778 RepID=A0A437MLB2_9SPHI|nr:hypothetical protein [Mucilaginibacter limnophilus]RVT98438.1 hypothetical protein EOD41_16745 [Mucilaginibacter limnophilus]